MKRVLIAEDEEAIREFEVINLQRSGYEVVETDSGEKALEMFDRYNGDFDLAVLDIMLPGIDGMKVCKELRERSDSIGIILLTAKTQEMDKISGLMRGADDYITKPFSPSELVARVDALYRRVALNLMRSENKFQEEIKFGEFVLNLKNRALKKRGHVIELTQVEFQIMEYFFSNPGTVLSRTQILEHVWGTSHKGEEKIVDVNIRRLRMKIEDDPSAPKHIITVWGMGYKWEN
ncbi:MAG: response regulator transcription factor [Clostridia bacterium]|nr:response regulator transcription factor [Clostridia bacterium]